MDAFWGVGTAFWTFASIIARTELSSFFRPRETRVQEFLSPFLMNRLFNLRNFYFAVNSNFDSNPTRYKHVFIIYFCKTLNARASIKYKCHDSCKINRLAIMMMAETKVQLLFQNCTYLNISSPLCCSHAHAIYETSTIICLFIVVLMFLVKSIKISLMQSLWRANLHNYSFCMQVPPFKAKERRKVCRRKTSRGRECFVKRTTLNGRNWMIVVERQMCLLFQLTSGWSEANLSIPHRCDVAFQRDILSCAE